MEFKDVENAKQAYKNKVSKCIWIFVAIAAVMMLISAVGSGGSSLMSLLMTVLFGGFFLFIIALLVVAIATRKEAKSYRAAYKAYFVEKNLRKTFTDLKYSHEMGLSKAVLDATQMVNTGDVFASNDLATGKYKDVSFAQADVHIQVESTDSDGNTTYTTIFKGRFMIYDFPKKFNFRLEVAEKFFGANRVPGKNKTTGRKFQKISLESPEFNKMFKTYAEDDFEAFYLLDPAFINNILELGQEYAGKLLLCFVDNRLVVGLKDGKDAFEPPGAFKTLDEVTETEKIARDIHLITNFVDKLKLNRKLFK